MSDAQATSLGAGAQSPAPNDVVARARVAVVGGTTGIGAAVVRRCAGRGAQVLCVGRSAGSAPTAPGVTPLRADLADPGAVDAIVGAAERDLGGLDALVYCAASFSRARIDRLDDAAWQRSMDTGVTRFFQLVRRAAPVLERSPYPRIVAISSITGPVTGLPGMAHYGASKSALEGFVRAAAVECAAAHTRITVNAVRPGLILTETLARSYGPERLERMRGLIPGGRLGTPAEVASAVCYLASPAAAFVTGAVLTVDGAQTLVENPFAP